MLKSFLIVLIQIAAIILLAITGEIIPGNKILLTLEIIFLLIAIWAMAEMKFRFNILPELLKNSKLVTSGPYKIVRHPIYTSIIFISLILLINNFSFVRLIVWMILVIILIIKSDYEENILTKEFSDYKNYKSKSKKLIPFIY